MRRKFIPYSIITLILAFFALMSLTLLPEREAARAEANRATQGQLEVLDKSGKPVGTCPLKQTTVRAEISGFLSRVRVTQEFENPFKEKI